MPVPYSKIKEKRESDPEYANRLKSYAVKYKENNLEKERERQRKSKESYREKSREEYNAYMREWTAKNKDRLNAERRERKAKNPEIRLLENKRRRELSTPISRREKMLRNTYGISLDEYGEMYSKQNGKCAICNSKKPNNGRFGLVVDHCHIGNHIRGLLCASCNNGLGRFKDNIESLKNAVSYLERNFKGE